MEDKRINYIGAMSAAIQYGQKIKYHSWDGGFIEWNKYRDCFVTEHGASFEVPKFITLTEMNDLHTTNWEVI